uniref:Uncharacterized protein n=1 Tax=Aegilops tauschii subsp. strangulata TaxID=200361 RepID=A0A453I272_AEGTS
MAVEVDGTRKRGAAAFLDDPFEVLQAKRGRYSPSATAASVADLGINMEFDPVEAVQSVFPSADPQLLRGYLEKRREMSWMLPSEASGIIWHRIQQRPMLVPPHLEVWLT